MKPLAVLGIVLIAIGVVALVYQGVTYTTTEKVVQLGPLEVQAPVEKTVHWPPILGFVALGMGLLLLLAGMRRT